MCVCVCQITERDNTMIKHNEHPVMRTLTTTTTMAITTTSETAKITKQPEKETRRQLSETRAPHHCVNVARARAGGTSATSF